jgi:hypothetical protein
MKLRHHGGNTAKQLIGWAAALVALSLAFTNVWAATRRLPTCEYSSQNAFCESGCTGNPIDVAVNMCNKGSTGTGCCNGFCQLFLCDPMSTCNNPDGFRRWEGYGGVKSTTCPENWATGPSCGNDPVYCPN